MSHTDDRIEWLTFPLLLLLCCAPFGRGGQSPAWLMFLELVSLLVLATTWLQRARLPRLRLWSGLALIGLCAIALVQLLPLPPWMWKQLAGRAELAADLQAAGVLDAASFTLSLTPGLTERAALALLLPVAMFLGLLCLSRKAVERLIHVFLAVALIEGLLALVQYAQPPDSPLRFGMPWAESSGSYPNRNHLAGLMEMALPLALALVTTTLRQQSFEPGSRWSVLRARPMAYAALAVGLLLGLVFSRSRMGLALALLGIVASSAIFARRIVGGYTHTALRSVLLVVAVSSAMIGLAPVLDRFAAEDPLRDLRVEFALDTLQASREYGLGGSGLGSFETVYAPFQRLDETAYFRVNKAHNDYLQALLEGGLPMIAVILAGLVVFVRRSLQLWREGGDASRFGALQAGAGIGIGLLLIHSVVDYNLQIPANAMYFGLLWALFLHPGSGARESAVD